MLSRPTTRCSWTHKTSREHDPVPNRCEAVVRQVCGHGKTGVVVGQIGFGDEPVGVRDIADPGELHLLDQPILEGGERPLRAAACFGAVGCDMFDAQMPQRPAHLGRIGFVHFSPGLGRVEVMAATVGIKRRRQAMFAKHLQKGAECRGGAFLGNQKG